MKGFSSVTIAWKGKKFTVTAEDQLRLIAEIEDALADNSGTPAALVLMRKGGPSYSRLAAGYGAALRYAGAEVSDDEIYLSIIEGLSEGNASTATIVQGAVLGLLAIIAPPVHRKLTMPEGDPQEKPEGEGSADPVAAPSA